jgi:hypothetical protein
MKDTVFARSQRLVLKNFRRFWYISTEDLVPAAEEACQKNSFQISFFNPSIEWPFLVEHVSKNQSSIIDCIDSRKSTVSQHI